MRLALLFLLGLAAVGCSGGPAAPETYPAQGKVVFRGPSLQGGMVSLSDPAVGATINGVIAADNTFTLETIKPPHRLKGAPAGTYDVEVVSPQTAEQKTIPIAVKTKRVTIEAKENHLTIEVGLARE